MKWLADELVGKDSFEVERSEVQVNSLRLETNRKHC